LFCDPAHSPLPVGAHLNQLRLQRLCNRPRVLNDVRMSTASAYFPLSSESPYTGGQDAPPGSANAGSDSPSDGSAAGASGNSTGAVEISRGAMIAIIVVVVFVGLLGSELRNGPHRK
jgi:hypothetical protein